MGDDFLPMKGFPLDAIVVAIAPFAVMVCVGVGAARGGMGNNEILGMVVVVVDDDDDEGKGCCFCFGCTVDETDNDGLTPASGLKMLDARIIRLETSILSWIFSVMQGFR